MQSSSFSAPVRSHPQPSESGGVLERAGRVGQRMGQELTVAVRKHPYATVATAAGFAFAIGALWKFAPRRRSQLDKLAAKLPAMPGRLRAYLE